MLKQRVNRLRRALAPIMALILLIGLLPVQAAAAESGGTPLTLANPGFEGTYEKIATGWEDNSFGTPYPKFSYSREQQIVRSGDSAQKITVTDATYGAVLFLTNLMFPKGKTYQAGIWMRAGDGQTMKVTLSIRQNRGVYENHAMKTLIVPAEWTYVSIKSTIPDLLDGRLQIQPHHAGILYLDDAELKDITHTGPMIPANADEPVPASLFGVHVNKLGTKGTPGTHQNWPEPNPGLVRLWDSKTRWFDLEPEDDKWNWFRMDEYLDWVEKHNPSAKIIYTLGQTPQWASANPKQTDCVYGAGVCREPADMSKWEDYVRTVATKYKGRIDYYELWNEPNHRIFYQGSSDKLYTMTKLVDEVLQTADPDAKVISSGVTQYGLNSINNFLYEGYAQYVDVIGFHYYFKDYNPDMAMATIDNVRALMESYGVGDKPLYITEASAYHVPSLPEEQKIGAVAKGYLLAWAHQAKNFSWYMWDEKVNEEPRIRLTENDWKTLTKSGTAYKEVSKWMVGSKVTSYDMNHDGQGTVLYLMNRPDGRQARVVWNDKANIAMRIPAEWGKTSVHHLDGTVTELDCYETLPVGAVPKMIVSSGNTACPLDKTSPVTKLEMSPAQPDGQNGWYRSPVTAKLSAADDRSGVAATVYRTGEGGWNAYSGLLAFQDGIHDLQYRSTDHAGNAEPSRSQTVRVDTIAPHVAYTVSGAVYNNRFTVDRTIQIGCQAADAGSGVAESTCRDVTVEAYRLPAGPTTYTATARDAAGNEGGGSVTVEVSVTYDSMIALTERLASRQQGSQGAGLVLAATLKAAKLAYERDQHQAAQNVLKAYRLELSALSGKKIERSDAERLSELSLSLPY